MASNNQSGYGSRQLMNFGIPFANEVDIISELIVRNVPWLVDNTITAEWEKYMTFVLSEVHMRVNSCATIKLEELINIRNNRGQTLIYLVLRFQRWGLIDIFLRAGADLNKVCVSGDTILHGIAWGNPGAHSHNEFTLKSREDMLSTFLQKVDRTLIFEVNNRGEKYYHFLR
jgi:hypothetical protein